MMMTFYYPEDKERSQTQNALSFTVYSILLGIKNKHAFQGST